LELDALAAMAENWHPNFAERQGITPRHKIRAAMVLPEIGRQAAKPPAALASSQGSEPTRPHETAARS